MTIHYFIHPRYEDDFSPGKVIDAASFKTLHPVAASWCQVLSANQEKGRCVEFGVLCTGKYGPP